MASGPTSDELDPRRAAPQERVDPREQLLVDERPREAVVGAGERAHPGRRIRAAEHDHRAVGHDAAVERLGVPEHEDVGIRRARQLLGALAGDDVEAVVAQLALEEAADGGFRLGEEQRGHATEARRRTGAPPDVLSRKSVTNGLQPAGADDAPEQPDPEHRREREADDRDDVHAEHLRPGRREDPDHARADQPADDDRARPRAG